MPAYSHTYTNLVLTCVCFIFVPIMMDFIQNLFFNQVSAFAPVLLVFAMCLTIFYKLRLRWPIKVNCWFCNEDAKILRENLNWWLCPWCEQYNGFSKTGDYLFDIPEQYTPSNKYERYCKDPKNVVYNNPSLCRDCNEHESLKLVALSNFEPVVEKFYDEELKKFKENLEKQYPLCNRCKSMVFRVLNKQAQWLTHYKMLFFRQKPIKAIINKTKQLEMAFRIITIILGSLFVYDNDSIWLPIGGLFFHLCAIWACPIKNNNYNMPLTFLWVCFILFASFKNLITSQIFWFTEHVVHRTIIICACIVALVTARIAIRKNTVMKSVVLKKLKHKQNIYDYYNDNNILNESSDITETDYNIDESSFAEVEPQSAILKPTAVSDNRDNRDQNNPQSSSCLDDSLSTLSLSEDSRRCSSNAAKATPAIFERKIYNASSSENLFRKSCNMTFNKRHILAPPKLRSVTQTSWVAGGYWQESMMTTPSTLSRSSSQSSGFGSAGSSNLAFSREPSVHEFDRCSIMSDGTRSCPTPRPNATNPARRGSPVPQYAHFRHAEASTSKLYPSSVSSPLLRTTTTTTSNADSYVSREPDVKHRTNPVPMYPSHTTTIIASPSWLSAMFCGSLVLNMIVLCTLLLHTLH